MSANLLFLGDVPHSDDGTTAARTFGHEQELEGLIVFCLLSMRHDSGHIPIKSD